MAQLVELDSRRQVALGRLGNPEHDRYLVTEYADGTLVLAPAVVMTAHEAALSREGVRGRNPGIRPGGCDDSARGGAAAPPRACGADQG